MPGPGGEAEHAYLFDLDGTLYVGEEPVPGAVAAIRRLADEGVPYRFLTNTTRTSRRGLTEKLRAMGFAVTAEELFTAPRAASEWLSERGTRRVSLLLPRAVHGDFAGLEAVDREPEAVVVGDLGQEWDFAVMNRAFRHLLDGAELVALQKNRYWQTPDGLSLDAGPFVTALEYASGREATVVGKPTREFFLLAARSLGVPPGRVTMVGDDVESDIAGALAAGMRAVLVRTGKFREDASTGADIRPYPVADHVAAAVALPWQ